MSLLYVAGESEDIIGQKSLVVDADDVPASSSSSSLSDSPTSTPARANIAASSLAPAKRASSTAFELSMSFAQVCDYFILICTCLWLSAAALLAVHAGYAHRRLRTEACPCSPLIIKYHTCSPDCSCAST